MGRLKKGMGLGRGVEKKGVTIPGNEKVQGNERLSRSNFLRSRDTGKSERRKDSS